MVLKEIIFLFVLNDIYNLISYQLQLCVLTKSKDKYSCLQFRVYSLTENKILQSNYFQQHADNGKFW